MLVMPERRVGLSRDGTRAPTQVRASRGRPESRPVRTACLLESVKSQGSGDRVPDQAAPQQNALRYPFWMPSGQKCYLCLRNDLLPMCPEWTDSLLAVRVGFEPTEPVKVQRFSRPPDSTTLAPHLTSNLPVPLCLSLLLLQSTRSRSGTITCEIRPSLIPTEFPVRKPARYTRAQRLQESHGICRRLANARLRSPPCGLRGRPAPNAPQNPRASQPFRVCRKRG